MLVRAVVCGVTGVTGGGAAILTHHGSAGGPSRESECESLVSGRRGAENVKPRAVVDFFIRTQYNTRASACGLSLSPHAVVYVFTRGQEVVKRERKTRLERRRLGAQSKGGLGCGRCTRAGSAACGS